MDTFPEKFEQEARAPDSIQFNLVGLTPPEVSQFCDIINTMGIKLQIFGLSKDNARAYWNWDFYRKNIICQKRAKC